MPLESHSTNMRCLHDYLQTSTKPIGMGMVIDVGAGIVVLAIGIEFGNLWVEDPVASMLNQT